MVSTLSGQNMGTRATNRERGAAEGYREPGEGGERVGEVAKEATKPSLLDEERQWKETGKHGGNFDGKHTDHLLSTSGEL